MREKVTGFILAGGQSRRMGRDKPLVEIGGVPLIRRVMAALTPCVSETIVVTNRDEPFGSLGLRTLADTWPGRGPLAGIHAALKSVRTPSALIVACDYPFLTPDALERILREPPSGGIVAPQIAGQLHPLCAQYAAAALGAVEESLAAGELMVLSCVARLRERRLLEEGEFGGAERASRTFMNINTPADLERAESLVAHA